jgi:hypothetical protein
MERLQRPSRDGSERARPHRPPRLEHRASQTLTIDLTDENDEPPAQIQDPSDARRRLRIADIIDLTDDNDVEITRVAPRRAPSPNGMQRMGAALAPIRNLEGRLMVHEEGHPLRHLNHVFPNDGAAAAHFDYHANMMYRRAEGQMLRILEGPDFLQVLAGQLQDPAPINQGPQKPDHVPPEPAKDGFTRSPTEKDVVICPSCEEELVHDKDPEEPVVKKGGKAPTRKEREEHPFWVVKACGHVSFLPPNHHALTH